MTGPELRAPRARSTQPLSLAAHGARSVRILRSRLLTSLSLGAAVVLGLVATCCGVGVVIAPLFLCELLAVQLACSTALGMRAPQASQAPEPGGSARRGWLAACGFLVGAVLLVAAVGWLVGLGLLTETLDERATWPSAAWLLVPAAALLALVFVLPYTYAPLLLIEGGLSAPRAVLTSALLVHHQGPLRELGLSLAAHGIQIAPVVLGSAVAHAVSGPEHASLWALAGLPMLAVTVPLGQGMLVSSYAQGQQALVRDLGRHAGSHAGPLALDRVPVLRARIAALAFFALMLAPVVTLAALMASLAIPSPLRVGELPSPAEPLHQLRVSSVEQRLTLPATALTIVVDARAVRVEASDGGGAGTLPLPSDAPIERVEVVRTRDRYAIGIEQHGQQRVTSIDRAGVRLDDDLRARLSARVSRLDLALIALALLLVATAQLPVLARAGDVLTRTALAPNPSAELDSLTTRALWLSVLLGPLIAYGLWRATSALLLQTP